MSSSHSHERRPSSSAVAGGALAAATLVAVAAGIAPALGTVVVRWNEAEYSHAWLIAPLAGLLFVRRFAEARRGGSRAPGLAVAVAAAVMILAGWATRSTALSVYGGIAGVCGIVWASLGAAALRALGAPIAFLLFLVPIPLAASITLSQSMQLLSSKIGVALMGLMGVTVLRDGNIIELMAGRLEVAEACSGLRYLFPLLSISFLLAALLQDLWWKKAVIFLSAIPIAVVMNAVRLAIIGLLVDRYGMGMAEGFQHALEGFVVFALCVAILVGEVYALAAAGRGGGALAIDRLVPGRRTLRVLLAWPVSTPFVLSSAILAASAMLIAVLPPRIEVLPRRQPLALYPMSLSDWRGRPDVLGSEELRMLQLTDYVLADYSRAAGDGDAPVNFYVAYYASQQLGVQIHSPRLCIPGGGWNVLSQSTVDLAAADGTTFKADRLVIEKRGVRQMVYYWYDERGRRSTGEIGNRIRAFLDALWLNRSDGALVRVVTPVAGGDEAGADRLLREFVLPATGALKPYIPA